MRFLTAGESHGPTQLTLVEGFPAGVEVRAERIDRELARRQQGYGRGARMKLEADRVQFLGGVRNGRSTGAPVAMAVENRDHVNWKLAMAPEPLAPEDEPRRSAIEAKRITRVRPGHADAPGAAKYRLADVRDVLERASARETAARVLAGALADCLLAPLEIRVASHVVELGGIAADRTLAIYAAWEEAAEASPVRCADPEASQRMVELLTATRSAGDTLGGIVEVVATGLPVGLGSYAQWDRRLDGRLAQALMSIPAIKGVEVGLGFEAARLPGSRGHDPLFPGFRRETNRAGGLEGGITNGMPLVLRLAMKPIPTLAHPLPSVTWPEGEAASAHVERSDVCAVPAAGVVAEAMVRWVIAEALLEKLGGDSWVEIAERYAALKHEGTP